MSVQVIAKEAQDQELISQRKYAARVWRTVGPYGNG
jgi:hypothetical protein